MAGCCSAGLVMNLTRSRMVSEVTSSGKQAAYIMPTPEPILWPTIENRSQPKWSRTMRKTYVLWTIGLLLIGPGGRWLERP